MKKCKYCGQENDEAAANCAWCGTEDFYVPKPKMETQGPGAPQSITAEAPANLVTGPVTMRGAFQLQQADARRPSGYKIVASSHGGAKVGFLTADSKCVVLQQRLGVAGGILLALATFISVLALGAAVATFVYDGPAVVIATLILFLGVFVTPAIGAARARRLRHEFNVAEISEGAIRGDEVELYIGRPAAAGRPTASGSISAAATAAAPLWKLRFKPVQATTPPPLKRLAQMLSQAGVQVRDAGQADIENFLDSLSAATRWTWVTFMLIGLNVAVFIVVEANKGTGILTPMDLVKWGADFGPLSVNSQEWWRLLAACFLHFGFLHLLFNMFALLQAGRLTERLFGNWFFLLIYLGCGVTASVTSLWFNPAVVSAGASGAVFGVYGALLGYLMREGGGLPRMVTLPVWNSAGVFVVWNLVSGFMDLYKHYSHTLLNTPGGGQVTDVAAHCGGLVCGLVLGFLGARGLDLAERRRLVWSRTLVVLLGIVVLAGLVAIPMLKANQPSPARMKMLAGAYYRGDGVESNKLEAVAWFKRAAEAGDVESARLLGSMYFHGDGVESNVPEAVVWFTRAAEQGDVGSERIAMSANFDGTGVQTNYVEGIKWLKKLVDQNADRDLGSLETAVGLAYYNGRGVPPDQDEAIKWLNRAIKNGDDPAKGYLKAIQQIDPFLVPPGPGDLWYIRYVTLHQRENANAVMEALQNKTSLDDAAAQVGAKASEPRWYKAGELQKLVEAALRQMEESHCTIVETAKGVYVVYLIKKSAEAQ